MIYEEFQPSPPLIDVVSSYWKFTVPRSSSAASVDHTIPPDGVISVSWVAPGMAVIVGPRVKVLKVHVVPGFEYFGARLHPGAGDALLRIDPRQLRDKVSPLPEDHAISRAMRDSGLVGLNGFFEQRVAQPGWVAPDPLVLDVARRIASTDGAIPVSALIADVNLSYRQILRRFHQASGLTIKEFARLRRLRAACAEAVRSEAPRWADISASTGFSDQAHLVREFTDVYGWPPRLVHEYLRRIDHVTVLE